MPHLTLEYAGDTGDGVDFLPLFADLHQILVETIGTVVGNCKSRCVRRDVYLLGGAGSEKRFVHLDVQVLEGRTPQTKGIAAERLLARLRETFAHAPTPPEITVYVRDLEKQCYVKHAG